MVQRKNRAPSRTWAELVDEGKKAARFQWELGDLAGEVHTAYGEHSLSRYADEIGVEYQTLRDYRRVSAAYPEKVDRSTNWTLARVLAGQPDRVDLVKTVTTVAEAHDLVFRRLTFSQPKGCRASHALETSSCAPRAARYLKSGQIQGGDVPSRCIEIRHSPSQDVEAREENLRWATGRPPTAIPKAHLDVRAEGM